MPNKKPAHIDAIQNKLFNDLYIDDLYVFYHDKQYQHNNEIYNTLKLNLKRETQRQLDLYIVDNFTGKDFIAKVHAFEKKLTDNARELIYKKHLAIKKTEGGIEVYKKLEGNTVAFLTSSESTSFIADISNYLTWKIKEKSFANVAEAHKRKELKQVLISDCLEEINEIAKISNDPSEITYCYIDINNLPSSATPGWDNFIRQFKYPEYGELFMAWVYSIFLAKNKSRQLVWIYGKGKSGKSTVGKVIYKALNSNNPILAQTLENTFRTDKYTMAAFEQCRFITIGDCIDRSLIKREEIKNITGADIVSVRKMHQEKKSAEVYCKILVSSNAHPYINLELEHETSRILYLALDDSNCYNAVSYWNENFQGINWEARLHDEFWSFLNKCKEFYFKWIDLDGNNFKQPDIMLREIEKNCEAYTKREVRTFWEYNMIKKEGAKVALDDINQAIKEFLPERQSISRIRSYSITYVRRQKIELHEVGAGNAYYIEGYQLKPLKDRVNLKNIIDMKLGNKKDIYEK